MEIVRDDSVNKNSTNFDVSFDSPVRVKGKERHLRKEVIQPHLPVRLPCYDFVPVIRPTLGSSLLAVESPTSGVSNSHDVTGGVYKARERIHRSMADLRLLATPASCRRVAACNPNYERLFGIGSTSRLRNLLYRPL